ncbi:hypothetical protein [Streptomyces sp. NPDC086023]|uniref:hypothetical protein n=1 Tax=Streptomyces sp. NPDC086023 TaxID=3365746 RepID=UPI0037D8D670
MDGATGTVLAGKFDFLWDLGAWIPALLRLAFGNAPEWVRYSLLAVVGGCFLWAGMRWLQRRGAVVRTPRAGSADETGVR